MKCPRSLVLCGLMAFGGCSIWNFGSPATPDYTEPVEQPSHRRLVKDFAVPFGMYPVELEGVGLVVGLQGTGSNPKPGPLRVALLGDMQVRGVEDPNRILASPDTALVVVRGVIRPGIGTGDTFDVELRVPSGSDTTSLRGGRLLETRLSEMKVLAGQMRSGTYLARAEGAILVDPEADKKADRVLLGRGRVLGGGLCLKDRPLALVLKPGQQSVFNAARIESVVNRRFHAYDQGIEIGMAEAKTDKYVELAVHPRYKDNVQRYVDVVRAVAWRQTESQHMTRLAELDAELLHPATASQAALELEAIGHAGEEVLLKGLAAGNAEVRFYAAEALAYLDRTEAVPVLAETARRLPAFRVFALGALSGMQDLSAHERLCELLEVPSAETRYGAFRALCTLNPNDPLVAGRQLGNQFSYHVLDVPGEPMVHVTRSRRPEVVLFGRQQQFNGPLALEAGNQILIRGDGTGEIDVSKFAVGESDQRRTVSNRVDDVIRAIVELGGAYPDVVQALEEAKACGTLGSRFEVDALPEAGRTFDRKSSTLFGDEEANESDATSGPDDLAVNSGGSAASLDEGSSSESDKNTAKPADFESSGRTKVGLLGKMMGHKSDI